MRDEIWAGFYHKISTDKKPQHDKCSIDWCKYLKAKAANTLNKYKHRPAPVCPDLKRERYTHNANSSTYVRMVARAA